MENVERVDKFLTKLRKIAACPVCFKQLPPDIVVCFTGHALCLKCQPDSKICPLCHRKFLDLRPALLSQMLEAIPSKCKHDGCSYLLLSLAEDHELWCSYRKTRCKLCNWAGPVNCLHAHCKHAHNLAPTDVERQLRIRDMDITYPAVYHNQVFWRTTEVDDMRERFTLKFVCVPGIEAKNDVYKVKVEFNADRSNYMGEIKLATKASLGIKESALHFHTAMLRPFTDLSNICVFNLYVTKENTS